jgi:hypothetical protein
MPRWEDHDEPLIPELEEGIYKARLDSLELEEHPRWHEDQVRWSFTLKDGRPVEKWSSLQSGLIKHLAKDLATLGVKTKRISELKDRRWDVIGATVEIKVTYRASKKTGEGHYQQVEVTGLVSLPKASKKPDRAAVPDEEDLPF